MKLVEFQLRPVDEIQPWGEEGRFSLSWFGFSDGFYGLRLGSHRLLHYSEDALSISADENESVASCPWVQYQVVRLWEDLLEILPSVLEPVPSRLVPLTNLSRDERYEWDEAARWWATSEKEIFAVESVGAWLSEHVLDTGYLSPSSSIVLWSFADSVTVKWDNSDRLLDGVPAWSELCGSHTMSRDSFLAGVQAFNDDFMSQMATRVEAICAGWNRNEISVDFDGLRSEQRDRATWLEAILSRPRPRIEVTELESAYETITRAVPLPR